ncbi:MAG: hypothetical protein IT299_07740 [Dehalococcoidia bacterium]|nr:hypothetical protein [Dehalococcoidia bacterium]
MPTDPDLLEAQANAVYERVRTQLRELLHEGARGLQPFPAFPGAPNSRAIELDVTGSGDRRGCVVLAEDGELYELQLEVEADSLAAGANEPVLAQQEQRVPLEGLPAGEYVVYAQRALQLVIAELRRRG